MPRRGIVAFALLAAGLALEFAWFVHSRNDLHSAAALASAGYESESEKLAVENRRLSEKLSQASSEGKDTGPQPVPQALPTTTELINRGLIGMRLRTQGVLSGADLADAIAGALALSPADTRRLHEAVDHELDSLIETAIAQSKVSRHGSALTIEVPEIPAAVVAYDTILAKISEVLGPESFGAFQKLDGPYEIDPVLNRYGLRPSTVTIAHNFDASRGIAHQDYFDISERFVLPPPVSSPSNYSNGGIPTRAAALEILGPWAKVVPDDL